MLSLCKWLSAGKSGGRRQGRPGAVRPRPALVELERRDCPAVSLLYLPGPFGMAGTLKVIGDNQANDVSIRQNDDAGTFTVTGDGQSMTLRSASVANIVVQLNGGDDSLDYSLGSNMRWQKTISVSLGDGNDFADLNFGGGFGSPQYRLQAPLLVAVNGGAGNDTVFVKLGAVSSNVLVSAALGDGDDTFTGTIWGTVTSGVLFNVQGQAGNDSLNFWAKYDSAAGSYGLAVGAYGSVVVNLDGGDGNDHVGADYYGMLLGNVIIALRGGAGNDTLDGELAARSGSQGSLSAALFGGDGSDALTLHEYDYSNEFGSMFGRMDGGAGWDTAMGPPWVSAVNCEVRWVS
jgi:hypothetical protein